MEGAKAWRGGRALLFVLALHALGFAVGAASATQVTAISCREGHKDGGFADGERLSECLGTAQPINLGNQKFEFVRVTFEGLFYSRMVVDYGGVLWPPDGIVRDQPLSALWQWSPVEFGISGTTFLDDTPPLYKEGWAYTGNPQGMGQAYSSSLPFVAWQWDTFVGTGTLDAGDSVDIYGERIFALVVEIPYDARMFGDEQRVTEFFAQYHFRDGNWWDLERLLIAMDYETGFDGVLTVEVVDEPPALMLLGLASFALLFANPRRRMPRRSPR